MESKGKNKLRGGTLSRILVASFSWLNELIKQGLVRELHSKQKLLSPFGFPEEEKSRIIDKFCVPIS